MWLGVATVVAQWPSAGWMGAASAYVLAIMIGLFAIAYVGFIYRRID